MNITNVRIIRYGNWHYNRQQKKSQGENLEPKT